MNNISRITFSLYYCVKCKCVSVRQAPPFLFLLFFQWGWKSLPALGHYRESSLTVLRCRKKILTNSQELPLFFLMEAKIMYFMGNKVHHPSSF